MAHSERTGNGAFAPGGGMKQTAHALSD